VQASLRRRQAALTTPNQCNPSINALAVRWQLLLSLSGWLLQGYLHHSQYYLSEYVPPFDAACLPMLPAGSEADPIEEGYQSDASEEAVASCCGMCAPQLKVEFSHTSMSIKHKFVPVMYLFNQRTDTHVSGIAKQ
jgi:hypothetical protein